MAYIAQTSNIQSKGAFAAIVGVVWGVFKNIEKVLISEGAVNARLRKVEKLSVKSDEELAMIGLRREDIVRAVFGEYLDT